MNPTTIDKGLWPGWTYSATTSGKGDMTSTAYKYFPPGSQSGSAPKQTLGEEYLGKYNAMGGVSPGAAEGGAAQGFFVNPTGKAGGFTQLTSSLLDDPNVFKAVRDRYLQFNSDPAWLGQLNTASDTAKKAFEGSSATLAPEVLQKMWK